MGKLIGSLEKQLTVEGEEINGYMDKMRRCSERGDLLTSPRAGLKGLRAVTPEQKVEKLLIGGKLTVMPRAKIGSSTKIGVISDFWTKN